MHGESATVQKTAQMFKANVIILQYMFQYHWYCRSRFLWYAYFFSLRTVCRSTFLFILYRCIACFLVLLLRPTFLLTFTVIEASFYCTCSKTRYNPTHLKEKQKQVGTRHKTSHKASSHSLLRLAAILTASLFFFPSRKYFQSWERPFWKEWIILLKIVFKIFSSVLTPSLFTHKLEI